MTGSVSAGRAAVAQGPAATLGDTREHLVRRSGSGAGNGILARAPRLGAVQIGRRFSLWPAWLQVLTIYVASRLFDYVLLSRVARIQPGTWMNPPHPGYEGFLSMWDGFWYRRIAETGYPPTLPVDHQGLVQFNEWAFYPLYPMSVRAVMRVLGTGWPLTASFVAMACGAVAVLVMYGLVRHQAGHRLALWTVALFTFFPSAAVLQLTYTEAMAALLLVSSLWCLQRRQYLPGAPLTLLLGLTRPIGVPLAAVVGLHVFLRIRHRRREPVPLPQFLGMLVMAASAAVSGFVWPYLAARGTGVPDAYARTMSAWRGNHEIVLFEPWWAGSRRAFGEWFGPLVLALIVLGIVWALTRPLARVIAGDLRLWVICYAGYLAMVLSPSTSLFRYLLLLFPLGTLTAAASPTRPYRILLLVTFAAGQIVWVTWLWRFIFPVTFPGGSP